MENDDFEEMLSALRDAEAEFLVVGAHALAAQGFVRAAGDMNIWMRPLPRLGSFRLPHVFVPAGPRWRKFSGFAEITGGRDTQYR